MKLANVALAVSAPPQLGRKSDEIAQPAEDDRLGGVGEPRRGPDERVLVEHRDGPVGGERRRGRAADHKVEEAWARRGGGGGRPHPQQRLDRRLGAHALLGQGPGQLPQQWFLRGVVDQSVRQRPQVVVRRHHYLLQRLEDLALFGQWVTHDSTSDLTVPTTMITGHRSPSSK